MIVTAVVLMILLTLFVKRTNLGRAMRSVSHDREAAAMMGVDIDRTIMSAFFIGSLLAGVAGVMAGLVFSRVFQLMGFVAGLKAFTGAVIGGIGSIPGAMLGGMLVGLAESFTSAYISSTFQNVIVFGVLIVFMLFRPRGLFGTPRDREGVGGVDRSRPVGRDRRLEAGRAGRLVGSWPPSLVGVAPALGSDGDRPRPGCFRPAASRPTSSFGSA